MSFPINPLLLLGLGGAVALAVSQRKTIMLFGRKAIDAANDGIFKLQLPSRAQPYSAIILRVSREESVDPFLIFALGDRETLWGTSSALDKQGPGGRGDNLRGHGLLQIDIGSFPTWLANNPWWDPYTNVKKGVQILKAKMSFFAGKSAVTGLTNGSVVYLNATQAERRGVAPGNYPDPRPLSGSRLWEAAIAAYNTGEGNVLRSIAVGKSPQITTAGGNYLTDVASRATTAATKYDNATV